MYGDLVESRRSKPVTHRSGAVGIEAKHREDSPCAHRTVSSLPGIPLGFVAIILAKKLAGGTLCAPCFLGVSR